MPQVQHLAVCQHLDAASVCQGHTPQFVSLTKMLETRAPTCLLPHHAADRSTGMPQGRSALCAARRPCLSSRHVDAPCMQQGHYVTPRHIAWRRCQLNEFVRRPWQMGRNKPLRASMGSEHATKRADSLRFLAFKQTVPRRAPTGKGAHARCRYTTCRPPNMDRDGDSRGAVCLHWHSWPTLLSMKRPSRRWETCCRTIQRLLFWKKA